MNPVVVAGLAWLAGQLYESWQQYLQQEAERERKRIESIPKRRRRQRENLRKEKAISILRALDRMIRAEKERRRAAAKTRSVLPWASAEREAAHQLVRELTDRIDDLVEEKRKIQKKLSGSHTSRR